MSFILDALRKSEHARQHLGGATLAELPLARRHRSQPWWVFALAGLLLINLVVLTIVLLRKPSEPVASASPATTPSVAPAQASPTIAPRSATPPQVPLEQEAAQSPSVQYETIPREEAPLDIAPPDGPTLVRPIESPNASISPTTTLPDLHIDMHVYSATPKDRFVFINMKKYVEGQVIADGARVQEITPDGVVLSYRGERINLVRP